MTEITDERITEIFRDSDMYREIDKYFDPESLPEFEKDFVGLVRECLYEASE